MEAKECNKEELSFSNFIMNDTKKYGFIFFEGEHEL